MTVTPPKFIAKPLEASVIEKIELSLSQCENIEFREILCPYCSTTLATVTINMREGFIVKCEIGTSNRHRHYRHGGRKQHRKTVRKREKSLYTKI